MSLTNGLFLLLAIGLVWLVARQQLAKRTGQSGFMAMFRREAPMRLGGMGREALESLLEDTRHLVGADAALRGLVLAGPFAVKLGSTHSIVTLVLLTREIDPYLGDDWLARWPYLSRGHGVSQHRIERSEGAVRHQLTLRGAPPIDVHFVPASAETVPPALATAFREGAIAIETGTPDGRTALERWRRALREPGNGAKPGAGS